MSKSGSSSRPVPSCVMKALDQQREVGRQGAAGAFQGARHADPPHRVAEAVTDQGGGDVMQPPQIPDGADRLPEHQTCLSVSFDSRRAAVP